MTTPQRQSPSSSPWLFTLPSPVPRVIFKDLPLPRGPRCPRRQGLPRPSCRARTLQRRWRRAATARPPCSPPRPELAAGGSQRRLGSGLGSCSVSGQAPSRSRSCSSSSPHPTSPAAEAAATAALPLFILL